MIDIKAEFIDQGEVCSIELNSGLSGIKLTFKSPKGVREVIITEKEALVLEQLIKLIQVGYKTP